MTMPIIMISLIMKSSDWIRQAFLNVARPQYAAASFLCAVNPAFWISVSVKQSELMQLNICDVCFDELARNVGLRGHIFLFPLQRADPAYTECLLENHPDGWRRRVASCSARRIPSFPSLASRSLPPQGNFFAAFFRITLRFHRSSIAGGSKPVFDWAAGVFPMRE